MTPLITAMSATELKGLWRFVRLMVANGADVSAKDNFGWVSHSTHGVLPARYTPVNATHQPSDPDHPTPFRDMQYECSTLRVSSMKLEFAP